MLSKYGKVAIALHWAVAILVLGNIAGAMLTEDFPKDSRAAIMALHKASGIIILFLAVIRIGWRLTHRTPVKPDNLAAWEIWSARIVHFLFYLLIVLVPLSGWVWMSASGKPISMFGLFDMPLLPVEQSKELSKVMHDRHETLGLAMLGLAVLHIAGALKHQLLDRIPFIQRMWP
jgi:cytochrome b561